MALIPAKCPECGGLIEVDNEKRAGFCRYCGQPFVVEDAIQTFNTFYNITNNYNTTYNYSDGAVVNIYEDNSKDFVIEAGVLKEYHGASSDVIIPDDVVEIGPGCFQDLKIKSVAISDSVTNIGYSSFLNCENLISITIPGSVTSIGNGAFSHCTSLTTIIIPDSVTSIGSSVFYDCTNLTSVTIGNSVTSLGDSAFESCTNLTAITIPSSVTSMGRDIFRDCTSLTSIIIDNGVTSISDRAFWGCGNLTSISIPNSVTSIGYASFYDYWKRKGLCGYCGGTFTGFFTERCSKCGMAKDY